MLSTTLRKRHFFLLILLTGLFSCSPEHPQASRQYDHRVVNYYADMLVVQEESKLAGSDSLSVSGKLDSLAAFYGLRREQIAEVLAEYKKDIPVWRGFYDNVIHRLDSLQRSSQPLKGPK